MKSLYDLVSLILFAGIAVLFLQRSASEERDGTALWKYLVAAVGCAVADVLGNNGYMIASIAMFVALVVFSVVMLRPFRRPPTS